MLFIFHKLVLNLLFFVSLISLRHRTRHLFKLKVAREVIFFVALPFRVVARQNFSFLLVMERLLQLFSNLASDAIVETLRLARGVVSLLIVHGGRMQVTILRITCKIFLAVSYEAKLAQIGLDTKRVQR